MALKQSYLEMIKAYPGGWDAMSAALGMTRVALKNRIYECQRQAVLVETAMQMQEFSGTTLFAEAVAVASGGTFVKLPEVEFTDNESLLAKFNELYAELGVLSKQFNEYISDNEVDEKERASLSATRDAIHRRLQELLALAFRVYCRD